MDAPIGVFDSGVGGLSVLRALRAELPHESFVYMADAGHSPYGEKGEAHAMDRSEDITRSLRRDWNIKALVIACNTATAAAVASLRQQHPDIPIVGVEPALKPAVHDSLTRHVGVIGTRVTLLSHKFASLRESLAGDCRVSVMPCDGLADAIEREDVDTTTELITRYLDGLRPFGQHTKQIDQLVLGCTHYVFIADLIQRLTGAHVRLLDTGAPVAKQTRRVLADKGALRSPLAPLPETVLLTSGKAEALTRAAHRWVLPSLKPAQAVHMEAHHAQSQ